MMERTPPMGGGSQFGPPNLQELLELTTRNCGCPCSIMNKEGDKEQAYCGQLTSLCKRHAQHRLQGRWRCNRPRFYLSIKAKRGFQGHASATGPSYTTAEVDKFLEDEHKEAEGFIEANTKEEGEDELLELRKDLEQTDLLAEARVTFDTATDRRPEDSSAETEVLRASLAAKTKGNKPAKKAPTIFFLVEEPTAKYSITTDAERANRSRIIGAYITHQDAARALRTLLNDLESRSLNDREPQPLEEDSSSSDDDSDHDSVPPLTPRPAPNERQSSPGIRNGTVTRIKKRNWRPRSSELKPSWKTFARLGRRRNRASVPRRARLGRPQVNGRLNARARTEVRKGKDMTRIHPRLPLLPARVPPEPVARIAAGPIPPHPPPRRKWQLGRKHEGRKPESETAERKTEGYRFGAFMAPKIPRKGTARKCLHTSSTGRRLTKL
jgi:hypothetical protein